MSYFLQIVLGFVCLVLIIVVVKDHVDLNKSNVKYEDLKKQYKELEYEVKKLEAEKNAEMDEERIKQIAREELDLVDPNDQYFYNDTPN